LHLHSRMCTSTEYCSYGSSKFPIRTLIVRLMSFLGLTR
jgi:hypothetical protein